MGRSKAGVPPPSARGPTIRWTSSTSPWTSSAFHVTRLPKTRTSPAPCCFSAAIRAAAAARGTTVVTPCHGLSAGTTSPSLTTILGSGSYRRLISRLSSLSARLAGSCGAPATCGQYELKASKERRPSTTVPAARTRSRL